MTIKQGIYRGERALFQSKNLEIIDTIFEDGESPLKESRDIELLRSAFKWKYPLWYCKNVHVKDSIWFETARAGVWYTDNITIENSPIEAPKNFRRCKDITLKNISIPDASETLWNCVDVHLWNVMAKGMYFAMQSENITADTLTLFGNYPFDGCKNVTIKSSRLISKDAFWNTENVTVYDSYISGEYLGWNSKNLTLVNCVIESLQGLCYIDNLVMKNCRLVNTSLAFEYSSVEADITSKVDSILNPKSGTIKADEIGELIIEKDRIDPDKTIIICDAVEKRLDRPEWINGK